MFVEKKKTGFKYVICFGDCYIEKTHFEYLEKGITLSCRYFCSTHFHGNFNNAVTRDI